MTKKSVARHEQLKAKLCYQVSTLVGRHRYPKGRFDTLEEAEQHKSSFPAHLKPDIDKVQVTPLGDGCEWVYVLPKEGKEKEREKEVDDIKTAICGLRLLVYRDQPTASPEEREWCDWACTRLAATSPKLAEYMKERKARSSIQV